MGDHNFFSNLGGVANELGLSAKSRASNCGKKESAKIFGLSDFLAPNESADKTFKFY